MEGRPVQYSVGIARHGALTAIFMCTTSTVADSSLQGARMRATCIGSEIGLEIEKGDLGIAVRRRPPERGEGQTRMLRGSCNNPISETMRTRRHLRMKCTPTSNVREQQSLRCSVAPAMEWAHTHWTAKISQALFRYWCTDKMSKHECEHKGHRASH